MNSFICFISVISYIRNINEALPLIEAFSHHVRVNPFFPSKHMCIIHMRTCIRTSVNPGALRLYVVHSGVLKGYDPLAHSHDYTNIHRVRSLLLVNVGPI